MRKEEKDLRLRECIAAWLLGGRIFGAWQNS